LSTVTSTARPGLAQLLNPRTVDVKLRMARDSRIHTIIYHPILKGSEYENENQVYLSGIVFDFRNASGGKGNSC
jgi:hypothetical protein